MKVVLVTTAMPHPFADTAARWSFLLISDLITRGHQVICLCSTGEKDKIIREAQELLDPFKEAGGLKLRVFQLGYPGNSLIRKALSLFRPFGETYYAADLRQSLSHELRQGYDVLHLEQLWSGWFGFYPRSLLNVHHFEIIDNEFATPRNFREWKTFRQIERATRRILRLNKRIRVFSDRLLQKAKTINDSAEYSVVPFALDLTRYELLPQVGQPVVGIIGSMHWLPSRSAAERLLMRIWPLVRSKIPPAKLLVAGWNARHYLNQFLATPGVEILDRVDHPAEFFSKIAALIYPVPHGSGMKVKVMESMAFGVPVVTTSQGVEGLSGAPGTHYLVNESDEAIAAETVRLLMSSHLRSDIRVAGRQLIEERYSRNVVVTQMLEIYKDMTA